MSDERVLSPTYLAMSMRRQWSPSHVYEANDYTVKCGGCGFAWNHPNHVTREEDRAEVRRWADRIRVEQERGE